jgi:hypothetical protein
VTDTDGGAILEEVLSSYETGQGQALLNEAIQLSLPLGATRSAEEHSHRPSAPVWPKIVSRRTGEAKAAASTVPSLADLARVDYFSPSSILSGLLSPPLERPSPKMPLVKALELP